MGSSEKARVVLGVCAGIAAYKAVEVCRGLVDAGVHVTPVLTRDAKRFIGEVTFSALASEPVQTSLWDERSAIPHTRLGQNADLILIVPATANFIASYASGLCGDLLLATLLATRAPVILCPAMHTEMWEHPAVQDNLSLLEKRGVLLVPPASGKLAGGDTGLGRLADPGDIVQRALEVLSCGVGTTGTDGTTPRPKGHSNNEPAGNGVPGSDLSGLKVLVSAGGTREWIDPVRFISNRSSGKQGYALAKAAAQRGASVTLVTTSQLEIPESLKDAIEVIQVESAAEMQEKMQKAAIGSDVVIMAAAVADFRPSSPSLLKLSKDQGIPEIILEPTPDILVDLVAQRVAGQVIVGFAAETNDVLAHAREKLHRKNVDLLVVNDVTASGAGFDHDTNEVTVIDSLGNELPVTLRSKDAIADVILDRVVEYRSNSVRNIRSEDN